MDSNSQVTLHKPTWFHPLSALVMIVCDFSGFAGDFFGSFFWLVMMISIVTVFFVSGIFVFLIQHVLDGNSIRIAFVKALIAGFLCAIPMPIFGTVAGTVILVKSGLSENKISLWKKRV